MRLIRGGGGGVVSCGYCARTYACVWSWSIAPLLKTERKHKDSDVSSFSAAATATVATRGRFCGLSVHVLGCVDGVEQVLPTNILSRCHRAPHAPQLSPPRLALCRIPSHFFFVVLVIICCSLCSNARVRLDTRTHVQLFGRFFRNRCVRRTPLESASSRRRGGSRPFIHSRTKTDRSVAQGEGLYKVSEQNSIGVGIDERRRAGRGHTYTTCLSSALSRTPFLFTFSSHR